MTGGLVSRQNREQQHDSNFQLHAPRPQAFSGNLQLAHPLKLAKSTWIFPHHIKPNVPIQSVPTPIVNFPLGHLAKFPCYVNKPNAPRINPVLDVNKLIISPMCQCQQCHFVSILSVSAMPLCLHPVSVSNATLSPSCQCQATLSPSCQCQVTLSPSCQCQVTLSPSCQCQDTLSPCFCLLLSL